MNDQYTPPSLRVVPNRRFHELTDEELLEELAYYDAQVKAATGWGAAVGEYQKNVYRIKKELKNRGIS